MNQVQTKNREIPKEHERFFDALSFKTVSAQCRFLELFCGPASLETPELADPYKTKVAFATAAA